MADGSIDGAVEIEEKWMLDHSNMKDAKPLRRGKSVLLASYENAQVVMKKIKDTTAFKIEGSIMSTLKHENVAKFIGVCEENTIVMEYVGNETLEEFLDKRKPGHLDLRRCLRFALDISRAMEYLHENKIIYRDLKPSNIVVTTEERLKLIDFGLARREVTAEMTTKVGSIWWIAPELFHSSTEKMLYTHKVDTFSFAMILWEMIVNDTPIRIFAEKKSRPSLDGIPPNICYILQKCWAENPDERPEFKTIRQLLLDALHHLERGE